MGSPFRARICRLREGSTECMLLSLTAISVEERNTIAGQAPMDSGRELHDGAERALEAQGEDLVEAPA